MLAGLGATLGAAVPRSGLAAADPDVADDDALARFIRVRIARQRAATAIVVGALRPTGASVVAQGSTRRGAGAPAVGARSVFEIASLTKVFTALLLADAVTRGEAGLDDPLQAYLPAGVRAPTFDGRAVTLTDLATHTAGLPLRPIGLSAPPDAVNKYAGYSLDQLWSDVPRYRLDRAPGSRFEYSNVGFALLGQGLARRLGRPFPQLLRERITAPLGLADTRFGEDPAWGRRRATGHDIDLQPIGPTDFGALNPAGGLRATAHDLLRLLALFLNGDGPDALVRASRLMLTVTRPGQDDRTQMALGWRRATAKGDTFFWSNGSGDGSRTFMGFNPARRLGVVALADAAGRGVDDIGTAAIAPGQAVDLRAPVRHRQVRLSTPSLQRFLGRYRYAPGDEVEVTIGAFGLLVGSGPSQFPIYPQGPNSFFAKAADITVVFTGEGLVLQQDGKPFTYTRVR